MEKRCIDYKELRTIVPYSRTHVNRLVDEPEYEYLGFPKRVVLGQCRVCWWLHEIMEWLNKRPRR
jgi:predicted DNA-binding transcriptional regulator AlpA